MSLPPFGSAPGISNLSGFTTDNLSEGLTNLYFTNERAQDAVGNSLVDSSRIDLTYDDAANTITADIIADSVSNTYLANMAQSTIKGRAAGAGTGDPTDLTVSQVNVILGTLLANGTIPLTADWSVGNFKITNVTNPTSAQDAATKSYVDAIAQGLSVKGSARLATAAALPTNTYLANIITITATGVLTIDGSTVALNDRILVKDEVSQLKNGVYTCTTAGAIGVAAVLTRSSDMDIAAEFPGAFIFIEIGTANAAAGFVCTNSTPPTVGTTAITFTQFSGAGEITAGNALTKTGNTLDVAVDGSTIEIVTDALQLKDAGTTNAKLANMAQSTIKGRAAAAGTGVPTDLTAAQVVTIINSTLDHGTLAGLSDNDHPQYGLLATANTWTQQNQFNPVNTTGVGLGVTRDLALANTDNPVVSIIQDNTGDDQVALYVRQDGTAALLGAAQFVGAGNNLIVYYDDYAGTSPTRRPIMLFRRSRGTEASPTVNVDDDILGTFSFYGYDGSAFGESAKLDVQADGTPGAGDLPGKMGFYTRPVGGANSLLALMLDNSQRLLLNGLTTIGASSLGLKAGISTNDAAVGGVLYVDSATHANGTTVETDLGSYSVPANTLSANGMSLEFEAWVTFTNNANVKTLKLYFGSDTWTLPSIGGAASTLYLKGYIVRTGAATQDVFYTAGLTSSTPIHVFSTATRTLSGANVLKLTGQSNTASNDVKQEYFIVKWNDANT